MEKPVRSNQFSVHKLTVSSVFYEPVSAIQNTGNLKLDSNSRYLSAKSLADRYKISTVTLWRWSKSPDFPRPLRFGRTVRFDPLAVDAFLKSQGA